MADDIPVLIIHTAPWCSACKQLIQPNNLAKITKLLKELNPDAEIKIVSNSNFDNPNKTDNVPSVNYFPVFPMLMVTNSLNCNRKGSMNKVKILNHNWDGTKLVKSEKQESIEAFLRRTIFKPNAQPKNSFTSGIYTHSKQDFPEDMKNKNKRRERSFKLIGINE